MRHIANLFVIGLIACVGMIGIPALIEAFKEPYHIPKNGACLAAQIDGARKFAAMSTEEYSLWIAISVLVIICVIFFVGFVIHDGSKNV